MIGAQALNEIAIEKSKNILKQVAIDISAANIFKEKIIQTNNTIMVIQRRWRDIRLIRSFQQEIVQVMWDKEYNIVEQYWLKMKSKSKKVRLFYNKLLATSEKIKKKILTNYMEMTRWRHCIIFARWRLYQLKNYLPFNNSGSDLKLEDPDAFKGKIYINESKSIDEVESFENEVDYLVNLEKFRNEKMLRIRRSLFKDVETGILDLEVLGISSINILANEKNEKNDVNS